MFLKCVDLVIVIGYDFIEYEVCNWNVEIFVCIIVIDVE